MFLSVSVNNKRFGLKKEVTKQNVSSILIHLSVSLFLSRSQKHLCLRREWQHKGWLSRRRRNEASSSVISSNFADQSLGFCHVTKLNIIMFIRLNTTQTNQNVLIKNLNGVIKTPSNSRLVSFTHN